MSLSWKKIVITRMPTSALTLRSMEILQSVCHLEEDYDYKYANKWFEENWQLSVVYAACYLVLIAAGRHFMKDLPKLDLRPYLITWNALLAVFSILGALRLIPVTYNDIQSGGLDKALCSNDFYFTSRVTFWVDLFVISKVLEFGDTAFIIARKQPLSFLHWYHHALTCVVVWYGRSLLLANDWSASINYLIHSIMYSYYCLRAARYPLPGVARPCITALQLVQMIIGVVFFVRIKYILSVDDASTWVKDENGGVCHYEHPYVNISLAMYVSYFLLFTQLYYNNYISKPISTVQLKDMSKKHH